MIKFIKQEDKLILVYDSDSYNEPYWVDEKLRDFGSVTLRRTFTFTQADLLSVPENLPYFTDDKRYFLLGKLVGNYYRISKQILGLKYDLKIDKEMKLKVSNFIANRDISIFRRIDELIDEPIMIGGNAECSITLEDFEYLVKTFPTSTEMTHYARARIQRILKDYFGTMSDAEKKLNEHLNRKQKLPIASSRTNILANFELQKFEYIYAELEEMLQQVDSYSEKDWQAKILGLLLLIFPRYISILENVHVKDFYSNQGKKYTNRYIDLMLVDASGYIDIIEVKKPFSGALLTTTTYRNNHTPKKELSGAIMQAEKYLFYLSKWGHVGEQEIYKKYKDELPKNIKLKVTNPKAIILLGRDNDFSGQQYLDFEVIRRQFANMLDIMTYDDLLRRVKNIIEMIKCHASTNCP